MKNKFLRADLTTLMSTTVNFQRVSTLLRVDPVPPVPFGFTIETAYDEFTLCSAKLAFFLLYKGKSYFESRDEHQKRVIQRTPSSEKTPALLAVKFCLKKQLHVTA